MPAYPARAYQPSAYTKKGGSEILTNTGNVILLLHGEGAQGANVITDDSAYHRVPTLYGSTLPFTDAAQKVFGDRSIKFTGAGLSNFQYQHADFALDANDYVFEFRHRPVGNTSQQIISLQDPASGPNTDYSYGILWYGSVDMKYRFWNFNKTTTQFSIIGATAYPAAGDWRAVRVQRRGTSIELYVNGLLEASTTVPAGFAPNYTSNMTTAIGRHQGVGYFLDGWLDEFRFVKGFSYPSGAYTPDPIPFPNP